MLNSDNKHKVVITDRKQVDIDGVKYVTLFDDRQISLDTDKGTIVVEGLDLKLENLEKAKGTIVIQGDIQGVFYIEKRQKNKSRRMQK